MDNLPANIKKFPAIKQRQWMAVWNSAYGRCMGSKNDAKACETSAFAQANGIVKESADDYFELGSTDEAFSFKRRQDLSPNDFAGKNRSFPIDTPQDVADAATSIGRAGSDNYDAATLKRNIISIAHRKGAEYVAKLPKSWTVQQEATAVVKDEPTPLPKKPAAAQNNNSNSNDTSNSNGHPSGCRCDKCMAGPHVKGCLCDACTGDNKKDNNNPFAKKDVAINKRNG
jgi:hypothetical protein